MYIYLSHIQRCRAWDRFSQTPLEEKDLGEHLVQPHSLVEETEAQKEDATSPRSDNE